MAIDLNGFPCPFLRSPRHANEHSSDSRDALCREVVPALGKLIPDMTNPLYVIIPELCDKRAPVNYFVEQFHNGRMAAVVCTVDSRVSVLDNGRSHFQSTWR